MVYKLKPPKLACLSKLGSKAMLTINASNVIAMNVNAVATTELMMMLFVYVIFEMIVFMIFVFNINTHLLMHSLLTAHVFYLGETVAQPNP